MQLNWSLILPTKTQLQELNQLVGLNYGSCLADLPFLIPLFRKYRLSFMFLFNASTEKKLTPENQYVYSMIKV